MDGGEEWFFWFDELFVVYGGWSFCVDGLVVCEFLEVVDLEFVVEFECLVYLVCLLGVIVFCYFLLVVERGVLELICFRECIGRDVVYYCWCFCFRVEFEYVLVGLDVVGVFVDVDWYVVDDVDVEGVCVFVKCLLLFLE